MITIYTALVNKILKIKKIRQKKYQHKHIHIHVYVDTLNLSFKKHFFDIMLFYNLITS